MFHEIITDLSRAAGSELRAQARGFAIFKFIAKNIK